MVLTKTARIARRNERITFQKNSITVDRYKNHVQEWADYFSCYAYPNTYTTQEGGDAVTSEERSITFHVRYCSELAEVTSTGYRIVFRGEKYNIISVDMMNYQKQEIRFSCRKEKR